MKNALRFMFAAAIASLPSLAFADRIDGDWCDGKGANLHIDGPDIRTPSGRVAKGEYTRHSFRYTGLHGENDEGVEIRMLQRSEQEMTLYRGSGAETGETWRRCNVTS